MTRIVCTLLLGVLFGCQDYVFDFQYDRRQLTQDFDFVVQSPSQADLLFVVDNSVSMTEEQQALDASIIALLATLAPADTSYRIALVSTDVSGQYEDCDGIPFLAKSAFTD